MTKTPIIDFKVLLEHLITKVIPDSTWCVPSINGVIKGVMAGGFNIKELKAVGSVHKHVF